MNQVRGLRISFICPMKNIAALATRIETVVNGNAIVACSACNNRHAIKTGSQDTPCRWTVALAIASLETEFGEIRSFDDQEPVLSTR